ncbi:hypothetical protein [Olleya marilimosa]|uniref:Uncharacterized protein n=1 Tax=Olleya marilimosa TaxID=272164 RepID=A0ABR8LRB1_9FLAO|nr:hypothetical protein [Olleya marilimosa]MBD3862760.1 hypothetical protein [Olleya marilimosa]
MNEVLNGIPLSDVVHNGSHGNYDNLIQQYLTNFADDFPNASPNECYDFVSGLIQNIRTAIANNPTMPINQLIF